MMMKSDPCSLSLCIPTYLSKTLQDGEQKGDDVILLLIGVEGGPEGGRGFGAAAAAAPLACLARSAPPPVVVAVAIPGLYVR